MNVTQRPRTRNILSALALAVVFGCVSAPVACAQADATKDPDTLTSDQLFHVIQAEDAALFGAYNSCDLATFGSLLADDLEFYHDKGGLMTGKQATVDGVKNNICGKVTRQLVPGTLEVYPIAHYGAVEIGVHRFYHPGNEERDGVGEAKFIHLWHFQDGRWKVARVISFDHHGAAKPSEPAAAAPPAKPTPPKQ